MKLTCIGVNGPYPSEKSGCSCYLVETAGKKLVLDLGSGAIRGLLKYTKLSEIDAVFISHLHYDHTSDLLPLRYALEVEAKRPLPLVIENDGSEWYKLLVDHPLLKVIDASDKGEAEIGGVKLSFSRMRHTAQCLAVKIESEGKTLVYTGDTMWNDNLPAFCEGADLALADCAKPEGYGGPHMGVEYAYRLKELTNAKIVATHLSPDYTPVFPDGSGIEAAYAGAEYGI